MKKTIIIAMAMLSFGAVNAAESTNISGPFYTEQRPQPEFSFERWLERRIGSLEKRLGLSEEQKKEISGIYSEHLSKCDAASFRETMKNEGKKIDEEIMQVLDENQKSEFRKMNEEKGAGRKPMKRTGEHRGERRDR